MIAIHIDANGRYQTIAGYCAANKLDKCIYPTSLAKVQKCDSFWTDNDALAKQYKDKGLKPLSDSAVDKWLVEATKPKDGE